MTDLDRSFIFSFSKTSTWLLLMAVVWVFCVAEPYLCVHVALYYFCILHGAVAPQTVPALASPVLKELYCV